MKLLTRKITKNICMNLHSEEGVTDKTIGSVDNLNLSARKYRRSFL